MKLTKKFIKENAEMTLKEAFPEVFEIVLEVGKWYKYNNTLFNYQNNGNIYGFLRGVWKNDNNWFWNSSIGVETATPQEIQDALEKEAVRRGYEKGVFCKFGTIKDIRQLNSNSFEFIDSSISTCLANEDDIIFNKGVWVEIIQTITKKEAEERLGMKII